LEVGEVQSGDVKLLSGGEKTQSGGLKLPSASAQIETDLEKVVGG
jgi:hypothetical protein